MDLSYHAMSLIGKTTLRRLRVRKRAETLLKSITEGNLDAYEGFRALYGLWCSYNAAVPELRPLFRMPGIEPDGLLSATDAFRTDVRTLAAQILPLISESKPETS